MIRRRLLLAATIVASVVLAACSDMTAPTNDTSCPVINGGSTCVGK
jgi:outer membrane murein-binding lipoprotein Lpp